MPNRSCMGYDTTGCSASSMQLSSVIKSSEGRNGATGITSLYNSPDAALTLKGGRKRQAFNALFSKKSTSAYNGNR